MPWKTTKTDPPIAHFSPSFSRLSAAIIAWPILACLGLLGLTSFFALPAQSRPAWLWYVGLGLGLAAPLGAVRLSRRLARRLADFQALITLASEHSPPPAATQDGTYHRIERKATHSVLDELGAVEDSLCQFLHAQHERLRCVHDARHDLEVVLQSMTEGVIVLDANSRIRFSNRAAHALLGLSEEADFQARPLLELSRHPVLHDMARAVLDSPAGAEALTQEIEIEGEQPRLLAVSTIQMKVSGMALKPGVILALHDLTELKQLEAVRADFVANVSHELRTPLTAIKGYAETLLNGALNDPPIATRFLAIIDRHSERLSRLIDDLLTLSDLERGKTELRRDTIVFSHLLDEVFELVKDKAASGQVRLNAALPASLPLLCGDADRLHQVLLNLVDNAVKYTPSGGRVTVSARASCLPPGDRPRRPVLAETPDPTADAEHHLNPQELSEDGTCRRHVNLMTRSVLAHFDSTDWLEVAVVDTGCGIRAADIPRLTQRFYRVDKARSRELGGTGLGLSIVKHIVQAHGGFFHIESQLDQGTTMRVFLPLGDKPNSGR